MPNITVQWYAGRTDQQKREIVVAIPSLTGVIRDVATNRPINGVDVAMQDLRLGLDLELAQLVLQALHDAAELGEVEVHGRQLLLEPRPVDADLARGVQHIVEEFRVDARDLAAIRARVAGRRSGERGRSRVCRIRRRGSGTAPLRLHCKSAPAPDMIPA